MKYSISVIGKKEEILAFKGVGVDTFFVNTSLDVEGLLLKFRKDKTVTYAVIFLSEELFQGISKDVLDRVTEGALPAIIPLPGINGSTGFGDTRMREFVKRAVGSDIFAS
ncbi:TPA: V-type ATP synthase subunit F [Candidatus Gracilibacteria bacterium]|nr:V-type ATP synthase subunit F [Candidatus Peregrinibacteria bacterium]HIQ56495.1 V-type ATP synthase subunit F [Candidatus Gracilibacteria bacterium]HIQ57289.1 V-type ATP synthase subunit F [Candidatus Gracilibacteria bacterium]